MENLKTKLSLLLALVLSFALFVGFQSVSAENAVEDAKTNVLTYEGMLARTVGDSGIRSLFRIDRAALKTLEENGYTVEIGALMSAAHNNKAEDLAVVADAEKGYVPTTEKTLSIVVYSSSGADYATNKYISANAAEYTFAYTTIFSEEYETAEYYSLEFCYRAFLVLTKDGVTTIEYVDTDGEAFDTSVSLYDVVKYFVSGGYTGEKAEEYANLEKFHTIVDAVESVTPEVPETPDEPEGETDWEILLKDIAENNAPGVSAYNNGAFLVDEDGDGYYLFGTAGGSTGLRYIDITVNVTVAGFYDVKYICTTAGNLQINHYFVVDGSVGSENAMGYFPGAGSYGGCDENGNPKEYAQGTAMYLATGTHTIRLFASQKNFTAKAIRLSLAEAVDLDDSSIIMKPSRSNGHSYTFTVTATESGIYKLYVLGASRSTNTKFTMSEKTVAFIPEVAASYYKQTYFYEIDEFALNAGDNTLAVLGNDKFGFGALYFVKVGDAPAAPDPVTLGTPAVTVDSLTGVATWDAIPNATGYLYKINGGEATRTLETSVTLLNKGDTLTVQALGDGVFYADGAWSESVIFNKKTILSTPVVTVSSKTGVASWTAIAGATGYAYKVNGGEVQTTTDTSVALSKNGDTITVMALGGGEYLDGGWSQVAIYEAPVTLSAPVVTVNAAGVASWTAITGATAYAYKVNGGAEQTTTALSVTLAKDGDAIIVRAIGDDDRYLDSAWSEEVAFVQTEFTVNVADTVSKSVGLSLESDGYYLLTANKESNYIEFTVNAVVPGLYAISLDAKTGSGSAPRVYFKNTTDKGDGWSTHATARQTDASTSLSIGTAVAQQYLYAGENTIRIYLETGRAPISFKTVMLSLVWKDNADAKLIVKKDSATNVDGSTSAGTGYNGLANLPTGIMALRGTDADTASATFTLPRVSTNGIYKVYVVGAFYLTTKDATFTFSNGNSFSKRPPLAGHYAAGDLHEIGDVSLLSDTDYTLTVTAPNMWANIHAFYLVRVGDIPTSVSASVTVDPENDKIDANVFFAGETNYLTMGLYDENGDLIRAVYREKTAFVESLSLSVTISESEKYALKYVMIFPTEEPNDTTPLDEELTYTYLVDGGITATGYTANKQTGEFSVTFDFTSFAYKYVTLVLTNAQGGVVAKSYTTLSDYHTSGVTLTCNLSSAEAELVSAMTLLVATAEGGTTAVDGMTGFTYRFVGDLRLLFVSDLHYNVLQGTSGRNNNLLGLSADGRAQHFVDSVLSANAEQKVDAVFLLGDLASAEDHYKYFDPNHVSHKTATSYDYNKDGTVDFDDYYASIYDPFTILQDRYLSQIEAKGIPVYCVPGNHDTIQNDHWEKIFGYKEKFGYTETEYIVKFAEHKTAVIMLNTFDEEKGSMTMSRNNDGKNYLAGNQQTLAYTPVDETLLMSFLAELRSEGYETVYIAAHFFDPKNDTAILNAAAKYSDIIKAFIYGDVHLDSVGAIGGIPAFVDGHYSGTLIEYVGSLGERYFDNQRLSFSYIMLEERGDVISFDYYKTESLYLGRDNYEYLSKYLTLTKESVTTKEAGKDQIILTTYVTTKTVEDGITKYKDTIEAAVYSYSIRTDLSAEDRALAERIVYQIKTYDMDMFMLDKGDTNKIERPNTEVNYYQTATGKYTATGVPGNAAKNGTLWCYIYLTNAPTYESFFKEGGLYKTYEFFAGKATLTYEDTTETTRTPIYQQPE